MKQLKSLQILLFGCALFFAGCASQEGSQEAASEGPVMKSYLNLKNALYEGDWAKAQIMAKNMSRTLEKFIPEDTANWQSAMMQLDMPLDSIAAAKDIKQQRVHFQKLSDATYEHTGPFKLSGGTLYRQFCPMAFDNKGAYWLSDKEEIENPYFGDEMPNCGSVEDTLELK